MAKKNPTTKPTKHVTVYARNNREIARALGLKTKPKQLVEIGEWIQREDFPAKSSKGYVIADLKVFFDKITPELALKKFRAQLADPESKLSPSEFNKLVELSGGAVNSTIAARQPGAGNRGVFQPGLEGMDAQPPAIIRGLTSVAKWIQAYFKISCTKQVIKHWEKETPPFPISTGADYRYRWAEVAEWVQKNKMQSAGSGRPVTADLLARLEPERISAELEEIEHERMLREVEKGAYLKKSDVARACQGIGKTINGVINNRLELRMRVVIEERIRGLACLPFDLDQKNAVIELFCQLGRETSEVLKAELRAAMMQLPADEGPEKTEASAAPAAQI